MLRDTLAIAALLTLGSVAQARAQDELLLDTISVEGAATAGLLDPGAPTALKGAAPLLATPQSVSIVTRHELSVCTLRTVSSWRVTMDTDWGVARSGAAPFSAVGAPGSRRPAVAAPSTEIVSRRSSS